MLLSALGRLTGRSGGAWRPDHRAAHRPATVPPGGGAAEPTDGGADDAPPGARGRWAAGSRAALAGGAVTAGVVLSPPAETWVAGSLTAHMTQHVLLIGLVAPFFALGAPAPRAATDGRRGVGLLAAGVVAQTALVLAWHAPPLFDAAEDVVVVHAFEHLCLLVGAWLLWWAACRAGGPDGWGPGALATFVALLPLTLLGVAMTFAGTPWYEDHRDLGDQQLGGVVMWAGGGLLALVGALALGVAWVAHAGDTDPDEVGSGPGVATSDDHTGAGDGRHPVESP